MKQYTEQEVEKFIKTTINECIDGFMSWIKNDTVIKDETGQVLAKAVLDVKDSVQPGDLKRMIYDRLAQHGIIFSENTPIDESSN